ncbi:acyl-CoA thioester hydrolase/BAAT C-terminal domain-containing protein, partial [Streptosporangium saharense]|uniref:acyl-CoA thioester hydrolase/BAAT C-terminal domain-containing protein n=1 Tax=Streptosporangium saharense TaxID=1706840 RepID=UPI003322FEEA
MRPCEGAMVTPRAGGEVGVLVLSGSSGRIETERSRASFAEAAEGAAIPVERMAGDLLLVAGADDRMWPSLSYAEELAARRAAAGRPARVVSHPDA